MIESNDFKWVICTPAKTGSYSLEGTLITRLGIAHKFKDNDRVGTLYDGKAKERILIVRNPLERWASMYWFALQKYMDGRSIFLADRTASPDIYAEAWLEARSKGEHPNFTATFTEMVEQFDPHFCFAIERVNDLMKHLKLHDVIVSHKNSTREKKNWAGTKVLMKPRLVKEIEKTYQADIRSFKSLW